MSSITECKVEQCSYNADNMCHAIAITVGNSSKALCDTFVNMAEMGGVKGLAGGVGACKAHNCKFNKDLECCSGSGIQVSTVGGSAYCTTFSSM
ncbi:MAG: DUF1540 domain-containing protein [Proteobacteria bacterium]|nr:DUF1540 domain-containing protein [Pseudomonadota bacterium]